MKSWVNYQNHRQSHTSIMQDEIKRKTGVVSWLMSWQNFRRLIQSFSLLLAEFEGALWAI